MYTPKNKSLLIKILQPFSWLFTFIERYLGCILAIVLLFMLLRFLTYLITPVPSVSIVAVVFAGALQDFSFAFVLVGFFITIKKILPLTSKYLITFFMLLVISIAVINSLFVSWARFPVDSSYFHYLSSITQLWFSIEDMIPWSKLIFAVPLVILFVCLLCLIAFGRYSTNILQLVCGAIIISSFLTQYASSSTYFNAVTTNIFLYLAKDLTEQRPHKAFNANNQDLRTTLVTTSGSYRFVGKKYPLIKKHLNYGQRRREFMNLAPKSWRPNVVFIFMESFRSHDIGVYNKKKKSLTPNFDRLAAKGLWWENFYANSVQTDRGALAALSSYYSPMGRSIAKSNPKFPVRGLASILRDYGYKTEYYHNGSLRYANKKAFFSNLGFNKIYGGRNLSKNFLKERFGWGLPDHILFAKVSKRLNSHKGKPLFLTLFTVTTHHPWRVPHPRFKVVTPTSNQYSGYQNCIYYSDYSLGKFFASLSPKIMKNTLFVITADTAQPMGEHNNNFSLLKYLYEENIRIPLLLYSPFVIKQPKVLTEVASQIDVMPTILDLLNIKNISHHMVGRSLLVQSIKKPYAYFSSPFSGGWIGLKHDKYKYFFNLKLNKHYLFDLSQDINENVNLASKNTNIVNTLNKKAKKIMRSVQFIVNSQLLWPSGYLQKHSFAYKRIFKKMGL